MAVAVGLLATTSAFAEVVEQRLASGVVANAEYLAGTPGRPAVLVLHGLLQTRNYLTISGLVDEVHDIGYAVIAPTLSLNIDRRKQSLDCEAPHTHSMESDIAEIAAWVEWLKRQGHGEIILIGHSFGSLKLLAYADKHPDPAVRQLIATSLIGFDQNVGASLTAARTALQSDAQALGQYPLAFCKDYVSPPGPYLSYAEWDSRRILKALDRLEIRLDVIIGAADRRMDADWPGVLRSHGTSVHTVPGANHFFSAEQEFALYDAIIPLLAGEASE